MDPCSLIFMSPLSVMEEAEKGGVGIELLQALNNPYAAGDLFG